MEIVNHKWSCDETKSLLHICFIWMMTIQLDSSWVFDDYISMLGICWQLSSNVLHLHISVKTRIKRFNDHQTEGLHNWSLWNNVCNVYRKEKLLHPWSFGVTYKTLGMEIMWGAFVSASLGNTIQLRENTNALKYHLPHNLIFLSITMSIVHLGFL